MKTIAALARLASASAVVLLVASGCAAPREEEGGAASAEVSAAPASDRQVVSALSASEQAARTAEFVRRNGPQWTALDNPSVDRFSGVVNGFFWQNSTPGPAIGVTEAKAKAIALELVKKNADLLGMTAGEVDQLTLTASPDEGSVAFVVSVKGSLPLRGYERFPELSRVIDLSVQVRPDGSVRLLAQLVSRVYPQLTLDTTPGLPANDARVLGRVLGTELAYYEGTGELESDVFFVPCEKHVEHRLGAVEAGDVRRIDPTVHVKETWTEQTFTLAYKVSVSRQGRAFELVVDAATGEVLEQPRRWPAGRDGTVWLYVQDGKIADLLGVCADRPSR